ncbi:MAG: M23 family metallopeptidase [Leptospiraceae bacterium]|nr:M23 family metallopeptidase [Leptospiraceae bacterium]
MSLPGVTLLGAQELVHPLAEPVAISGSFGEYRFFSRYHMGLDYKTWLINGLPVRSPAPARLRSIHVSEQSGYGNALFLSATQSGLSFTLAHLRDFQCPQSAANVPDDLELLRLALRTLVQDRPLRLHLPPWFHYEKGACLASTGESGSGPPHLHFEVLSNGHFQNPVVDTGLRINDDSPPVLQHLYMESDQGLLKIPLKKKPLIGKSLQQGRLDEYVIQQSLPRFARKEWIRLYLGGYDTMAARNRNGWFGLETRINERKVFAKQISTLSYAELNQSARLYHTALTQIGREYVYRMYAAGSAGFRLTDNGRNQSSAVLELIAFDASGNRSIVRITVPLGDTAEKWPMQSDRSSAYQSQQEWHAIHPQRMLQLSQKKSQASMTIRMGPGAVQLPGKLHLSSRADLPAEAARALRMDGHSKSPGPELYAHKGPVFMLEGQDLYYKWGGQGVARFPVQEEGRDGLYYYSYAKKIWRLMALPRQTKDGFHEYRFSVRITGPITQLSDLSAPAIVPAWRFDSQQVWIHSRLARLEFAVREYGSGIDLTASQILWQGQPIPFSWNADRSVIEIEIPARIFPDQSAGLLSLQVEDRAHNRSGWRFYWLQKKASQAAAPP